MPLQTGTRVGGYEIVALLGAGGMGEVYRARDTRLGREVAIKILSPRIAADRDAIVRFEREARSLAALNHPNIAAIYDVIEHDGLPALILELVDGDTLADRLARGPLPINEAIACAKQIADALDVAHETGIVHRDLKPGNIKITDDGRAKVLDFGLAKALALAAGESPDLDPINSPTITVGGTRHGVILGTAAYMSPEQARGKRLDKRTDIWAFGCVLFEMLTAKRAFSGETTSDVIAAIIERAPDLSSLPSSTPLHIRRIIERCLEKDVKKRARDIGDVRVEIDAPSMLAAPTRSSRVPQLVMLTSVLLAAAALVAWIASRPTGDAGGLVEFSFAPPPGYSLGIARPSVSPDGQRIAFVAVDEKRTTSVWIRSLSDQTARRLESTDNVINTVEWSPDGRAIAFLANNAWRRTSIDGGPPVTIVPDIIANLGLSWGADNQILVATANRTSLSRVSAGGGVVQPATTLDVNKENSHRFPQWLPDNRHFLFTVRSDRPENLGIKVGAIDSGDVRTLINVASNGAYAAPGYLLYVTPDETLMAQPLDASTWKLQGTPQSLAAPVAYNGPSFNGVFGASTDGRVLAYVPATRVPSELFWFDRTGKSLGPAGPEAHFLSARASRDGKMIAVEMMDGRYGTRDVWLLDTSSRALTRLTTNPATDWRPVFSPDRSSVAFASDRSGASTIFRVGTEGGAESVLYRNPDGGAFASDWSSDGKYLLATLDDRQGRSLRIVLIPVAGGSPITLVDGDMGRVNEPRFSSDGNFVAFGSDATGSREIYVMSIRDRRRIRVSMDGGSIPVWGTGHELFFLNSSNALMRTALDVGTDTTIEKPEQLFVPCVSAQRTFGIGPAQIEFDVTGDGRRFVANCNSPQAAPSTINVIVNWQRKLK